MIIGQKIRELREQRGLLLRQVAAELEVDTAYISKMERGEKNIKKEFIVKLAYIYGFEVNELIAIWLADKILETIKDESSAKRAISIANTYLSK